MEVEKFVADILKQYQEHCYPKNIVDVIFTFVENDRVLMKQYLDLVSLHKNLDTVNSNISQEIKRQLNLKNANVVNKKPQSKLIQSFTELEK